MRSSNRSAMLRFLEWLSNGHAHRDRLENLADLQCGFLELTDAREGGETFRRVRS
jgi:hypothetical protein